MRSATLAFSLTLLLATMALATPNVSFAADGDGPPEDVPDGMEWIRDGGLTSNVLGIDAEFISDQMGWSLGSTKARLRAQLKMDEVLPVLLERVPSFAGIYWTEGDSVVAQFTKSPPDWAIELLESTGATVSTKFGALSAAELDAVRTDVVSTLQSLTSDDSLWIVGVDPKGNAVVVTLDTRAGLSKADLIRALPESARAAELRIEVVGGPIYVPLTARGGAEMRIGTTFQCTAGFTVFDGGTTGISTAGHCTNSIDKYFDNFNSVGHNAPRQGGHVGTWGDFQWHTTSGTEVDDFFHNNNGNIRDVTGVKNSFSSGDSITAYGRGGPGNQTGTVGYVDIWTGSTGKQVCTNQFMMTDGDSGGPVYTVGVAAGNVTSHAFVDGAWRFCFSQARYIDDAMGVSIMQ